jgi:ElaB/YqjD/DUF883 family membrane-anchored ribosome-binding protein
MTCIEERFMDQQRAEAVLSDATTKVGDTVGDLAVKTGKMVQDTIAQGTPVLRDLQASAGAAIDKAAGLARDASSAGIQAVAHASDAIQGTAREVGKQVDQAVTTAYQQGARAGGYVSRYAAEQPLTALLIAGAIGYGLAYLIHRTPIQRT